MERDEIEVDGATGCQLELSGPSLLFVFWITPPARRPLTSFGKKNAFLDSQSNTITIAKRETAIRH